jgi:hypothetical protein
MNDTGSIEAALAAWQAEQRLRGGYTQIELDELVDHVRSSATELTPTAAERVQLAAQRVGAGAELAREYERVRGARVGAITFSPAGLLTTGALLWVFIEQLIRGTRLGVTSLSLWFFPDATDDAVLVGSLVSIGVVALLATLLSSERRARTIGEHLSRRPWRLMGACTALAIAAFAANTLGMIFLTRVADPRTSLNAMEVYVAFLPAAGYVSSAMVPLLLFLASIRAARKATSLPALEQTA